MIEKIIGKPMIKHSTVSTKWVRNFGPRGDGFRVRLRIVSHPSFSRSELHNGQSRDQNEQHDGLSSCHARIVIDLEVTVEIVDEYRRRTRRPRPCKDVNRAENIEK